MDLKIYVSNSIKKWQDAECHQRPEFDKKNYKNYLEKI